MNTQEHEQLTRFLKEMVLTRTNSKDIEAENLILDACRRQPDAHYLLVQRNLLLEQALKNVEAQNLRLQTELENSRGSGGNFLNDNAWGNSPVRSPAPQSAPAYLPPVQPAPAQATNTSWGSGILGTVATTAAGVVAGSFLFQGIEHLIGNHRSGSGFLGGQSLSSMSDTSTRDVVTDNSDHSGNAASDLDSLIPSDEDIGSV